MRTVRSGLAVLGATLALFAFYTMTSWAKEAPGKSRSETPLACVEAAIEGASTSPSRVEETGPAVAPSAPGTAGMRVFLDPRTGRRVARDQLPPQALSALEQGMMRRDSGGLTQRTRPDGTVTVDLQGRFHSFAVARIDSASGSPVARCVASATGADATLSQASAPDACHDE